MTKTVTLLFNLIQLNCSNISSHYGIHKYTEETLAMLLIFLWLNLLRVDILFKLPTINNYNYLLNMNKKYNITTSVVSICLFCDRSQVTIPKNIVITFSKFNFNPIQIFPGVISLTKSSIIFKEFGVGSWWNIVLKIR